jgi:MFS family permease
MFMASCTIICVGGAFSGLMFNYNSLCFSRFIVGIGVGGLTIPFDILAEVRQRETVANTLPKVAYR